MEAAEKAFARARVVDKGRQRLSQLARMHAHMCQGLGQHRRAIDILTEALDLDLSPDATVECLHLRGNQQQPIRSCSLEDIVDSLKAAERSTVSTMMQAAPSRLLARISAHA